MTKNVEKLLASNPNQKTKELMERLFSHNFNVQESDYIFLEEMDLSGAGANQMHEGFGQNQNLNQQG